MNIDNEKLKMVTGGNTVQFSEGQPVCPVCGVMGNQMKVIEKTPYSTVYQCGLCGQISSTETAQPETPVTSCPICGAAGAAFKVIGDSGSRLRYRCMICGHETESVK